MNKFNLFMRAHSPSILTAIGASGVIITTILAVKATPKAMKIIETEELLKSERLTTKEKIQVAWKPYIPCIIYRV